MIYLLSIILLVNGQSTSSPSRSVNGNEYTAIGFGLFFFLIALLFFCMNERRHLVSQGPILAAQEVCRTSDSSEINANLNMKLVHVTALTKSDAIVTDPLFNIKEANTIKIERQVEMYQWVRESNISSDNRESFTYSKEWSSEQVNTQSNKHINPVVWIVKQEKILNPNVEFGSYNLSYSLTSQSNANIPIYLTLDQTNFFKEHIDHSRHPIVLQMGGYLYLQQSEKRTLGDLRIRFFKSPCGTQTVISQQKDITFQPYILDQLDQPTIHMINIDSPCCTLFSYVEPIFSEIDWIFEGRVPMAEAFKLKLWPELKYTYTVRGISWFVLWFGLLLIFIGISDFLDWIKMVNTLYPSVGWFAYVVLTLILSILLILLVISSLQVYYKETKGIIHLAISGTLFIVVWILLVYA